MNNDTAKTPISGIKCDVNNCHYHRNGGKCVAGEIKVGPQFANNSSDTICDTFKPEDQQPSFM